MHAAAWDVELDYVAGARVGLVDGPAKRADVTGQDRWDVGRIHDGKRRRHGPFLQGLDAQRYRRAAPRLVGTGRRDTVIVAVLSQTSEETHGSFSMTEQRSAMQ